MNPRYLIAALACALTLPLLGLPRSGDIASAQEATPADTAPPELVLGGRRWQRLGPVLEAFATCSEHCEFEAWARVEGAPGLRHLRVVTPAKAGEGGTRMRFELRVSRRAHKLINASLSAGGRVRVQVNVVAYDFADNSSERSRWIRVLPPGPPPVRRS